MIQFVKGKMPALEFKKAIKKPVPVQCAQIHEAFTVETMEGIMQGKPGDWLIVGVHGEMYPIDKDIFRKTYDVLSEEQ